MPPPNRRSTPQGIVRACAQSSNRLLGHRETRTAPRRRAPRPWPIPNREHRWHLRSRDGAGRSIRHRHPPIPARREPLDRNRGVLLKDPQARRHRKHEQDSALSRRPWLALGEIEGLFSGEAASEPPPGDRNEQDDDRHSGLHPLEESIGFVCGPRVCRTHP